MKKSYIYLIINPNGRKYVGSTSQKSVQERWKDYYNLQCKDQPKLYNSFKKYGVKNHKFVLLLTCDFLDMYKYEYLLGHFFKVLDKDKGMNCKLPAWGDKPVCLSEEVLKRMSESRLGNKNPMFGLKGKLNPNFGRKCSEESKKKMSISQTGKILSLEHKKNISQGNLGKQHSQETKDKLSKNHTRYFLGKKFTTEHKKRIGDSQRGKNKPLFSEEHKRNLSKAKTGIKQSDEHRLKSINAAKKSIIQYDLNDNFIKEWDSAIDATRELKLKSSSGITAVCKNKRKTAYGFKWKYKK